MLRRTDEQLAVNESGCRNELLRQSISSNFTERGFAGVHRSPSGGVAEIDEINGGNLRSHVVFAF
jgi:hypothetical protein